MQLMENAGKAVADEITQRFPSPAEITVYAGTGRNGGDGMVTARHLASRGYHVTVVLIGDPDDIHDESTLRNWCAINGMSESVRIEIAQDSSAIPSRKCDVVIDALL
ncbi:MAG: NAD(P)H-hydrate epimerase, partial [Candidatus Bathyarchaeia archaeon]